MASSYYENHPYSQHRRAQTADFHDHPYANTRASYAPSSRYGDRNELVPRDDNDDSQVEEIQRSFPPGSYSGGYRSGHNPSSYDRRTTFDSGMRRTHSLGGRDRHGHHYYARDEDYRRSRHHGNRRDRDRRSRRSYSGSSTSRSPSPRPRRRKSLSEQALSALGLGSGASHSSKHHARDRDYGYGRDYDRDSRSRRHRRGHSSSRSRSHDRQKEIAQTLKAALTAGAAEAIRARKEPGGWSGEKGKRILTAAIGAGGVNKLVAGDSDKHSKRHLIESTIAGLATNRLVNGPRSHSRSRGRAQSESRGVKDVAATGLLAAAGKSAYDRYRSKSRGRTAHSDYSSDDSRPSRHHRGSKKRSQSVSEYLNKGLAALGLGEEDKSSTRSRGGGHGRRRYDSDDSDDEYSDTYRSSRRRRSRSRSRDSYPRDVSRLRSSPPYRGGDSGGGGGGGAIIPYNATSSSALSHHQVSPYHHPPRTQRAESDTSSYLSTDEEKRTRKKLRKREIVATSLATIATVHAGHTVVKSLEKRKQRNVQLREGEISPDEARRQRMKNNMKDVASVGIAALGVKSAVDEWKEAAEHHEENRSFNREVKGKRERMRARSLSGRSV
ncbi:hypothetical protein FQN50_008328 [Emmonsiellopsis sp. PD_5]|nr:hypothetical protein FQN50_008328 [Emmonsiellopsis sp. PD_5]